MRLIWVALFGFSKEAAFLNPKIGNPFQSVVAVVVAAEVVGVLLRTGNYKSFSPFWKTSFLRIKRDRKSEKGRTEGRKDGRKEEGRKSTFVRTSSCVLLNAPT